MYLTGLGTAVPPQRFTQAECWSALQRAPQFAQLNTRAHAVLRKVLSGENGIATRHLAVTNLEEAFVLTPDALHARFATHAPALATQAAVRALAAARLAPADVDAILISTCTGCLCPGLTSYVSERLGLRADVQALDLVGQGCGAALPNCRTAEALLASGRARHVLSVCVEVCSAAFYLDNDPGVLISACLFGDGAGAAVWSAQPAAHARRVEWKAADTFLSPADRDALRFEQRAGMMRNILTREVPALAARHVEKLLTKMLEDYSLERAACLPTPFSNPSSRTPSPHEERVGRGPGRGAAEPSSHSRKPPLPNPLLPPREEREPDATTVSRCVQRADVTGWILHAGGREVLAALQQRPGFRAEDLQRSAAVLREFGNVSSPFVFFVLERALAERAPGGWWWMSSFGAGFSCHGAFLKVD